MIEDSLRLHLALIGSLTLPYKVLTYLQVLQLYLEHKLDNSFTFCTLF